VVVMPTILDSCNDLQERIYCHLASIDSQRDKYEKLKSSNKTLERLRKRILKYIFENLGELIVFNEFLLELKYCESDLTQISALLDEEDAADEDNLSEE